MEGNVKEFQREYLCEPVEMSKEEKEFFIKWVTYRYLTMRYDKKLPHSMQEKRDGNIIIVHPAYMDHSARFAKSLVKDLNLKMNTCPPEVNRMQYNDLREYYNANK